VSAGVPEHLAAPLAEILRQEPASGNQVVGVGDWAPRCELIVFLKRPFTQPYPLDENVTLEPVDDPHYWLAEYQYRGGQQALACKFGW
jgi:hypothetical protein